MKVGKALRIGSKIDDTLTVVGPKGIQFIEETMSRGISRKTADKKLLERIGRGETEYLAARKFSEPSVHILGQKLFYTHPYTQAARKVWDVLPYAKKRAKGVDTLKTAFVPFHKAAQDVGEQVKTPFLQFYRQTAYKTSRAKAEIKKISKKTPKELSEDVVTQLTAKHLPIESEGMTTARKQANAIMQAAEDQIAARQLATPPPPKPQNILDDYEGEAEAIEKIREDALIAARTVLTDAKNAEKAAGIDTVATRADDPFSTQSIGESAGARSAGALDPQAPPPPQAAVTAADKLRAIYDAAHKEKLEYGLTTDQKYRSDYMHHALTPEGEAWVLKMHGGTDIPGHGPLQPRKFEGSVFEVNEMLYQEFGVKQFFVEDPYQAAAIYIEKHNKYVQPHRPQQRILDETGSPSAAETISTALADIDELSKTTPKGFAEDVVNLLEVKSPSKTTKTGIAIRDAIKLRGDLVSKEMTVAQKQANAIMKDAEDRIAAGKLGIDPPPSPKPSVPEVPAAAIRIKNNAIREDAEKRANAILSAALDAEPPLPQVVETATEAAARELHEIYDKAFQEKLDLGIVKESDYQENFMYHAKTKEATKWLKTTHGGTKGTGRSTPLRPDELEGSVFEVNERMREDFGIKQFFVEDPYIATQMYMAEHARQVQSHLLHQKILKDYGRDTDAAIGLAPEFATINGVKHTLYKRSGKETYLPTAVHKELDRTHPKRTWWTDTYDPALGALKKSWLAMWPGYYLRNLYGGVGWQNFLAGVEPADYARNMDVLYGNPNKIYDIPLYGKKTGKELKELMESRNVLGQTGYIGEPSSIGPLSPIGQIYQKYPEQAMKLSENQLRGPVFLHYLYKTGDPDYAEAMVYKYHFEYLKGTYTAFEENKLFRAVPFGMWTVGNVPLQAESMVTQPGKFAALARFQNMGSTPEEYNQMAEWQKEQTTYVHNKRVFSYDLPITDAPGMYRQEDVYFAINPLFKFGVQELSGKDQYGRERAPWDTTEGAIQQAELAAIAFEGRYYYLGKELEKTAKGERPVSSTAIHQLGGVGVYELPPQKPVGMAAFKASRWHESGAYAAWLAAGGTTEAPQDTGEPVRISSKFRRTKARVIRVIDGDTIEVEINGKLHKVRYSGIDTPETVHPKKGVEPGGLEASAANKRLVEGQTVYLEKDKKNKDRYGRLLRNVFLEDDTFINAELVRLGYAEASYYKPNKRYKEQLEKLEEEAQEIQVSHPWGGYGSLKELEYATWIAAGSPKGFHIKTLPGGSKLALTHEAYEASKGFKPTERQLRYINKPLSSELSALESPAQTMLRMAYELPGSREARYDELVAEWNAFKSGEMRLEQPTPAQEMESWERAGRPSKWKQKIYRDELGKLLGVATYTPEELEAIGAWKPSETEAEWAFRETRKMRPKHQFRKWAQEHKDELLQEEALEEARREELAELQYGSVYKRGDRTPVQAGSTGERFKRRRELEEMLGIGVDR